MGLTATFHTGRDHEAIRDIQRLRKRLFVDRLGWSLTHTDGCEIDAFDQADTIHLGLSENGCVRGTFRAIRCDRPYLAAEVFPQLAVEQSYPRAGHLWEISRFGVLGGDEVNLARINYACMFYFAEQVGATGLVAIADLVYERFLRSLGVRTRRYGPPQVVGVDAAGRDLQCVAGEIPLALQNPRRLAAFTSLLSTVEVIDETYVLGRARVSA